jgi:hypothetical protein
MDAVRKTTGYGTSGMELVPAPFACGKLIEHWNY